MELWKVNKLDDDQAIREMVRAKGRTKSYIQEVEFVRDWMKRDAEQEMRVQMCKKVRSQALPFVKVPEVEAWKRQYAPYEAGGLIGKSNRFKFLVLTGASRTGKTEVVKSLFEPAFLAPCQGSPQPNLLQFDRAIHRSLVCDEVNWRDIAHNQMLYQAHLDVVCLAQSQCQQSAYMRWLYGVPIICCMNDWLVGADHADHEDKAWLESNAVVVHISRPLWQDTSA